MGVAFWPYAQWKNTCSLDPNQMASDYRSRVESAGATVTDYAYLTEGLKMMDAEGVLCGLTLWHSANLGNTLATRFDVKGNDCTQATASNQSAVVSNVVGGKAAYDHTAGDRFYRGTLPALNINGTTVYKVFKPTATAFQGSLLFGLTQSAADSTPYTEYEYGIVKNGAPDRWSTYHGDGTSYLSSGLNVSAADEFSDWVIASNSRAIGSYVIKTLKSTAYSSFNKGDYSWTNYIVGSRGTGAPMRGYECDTILFRQEHSEAQQTAVNNFLRTYYGL